MTLDLYNDYISPPEANDLPIGETHVWRFRLDPPQDKLGPRLRLLDEDEAARASRFHFERHRRRFIAAHGAMRVILGRYLAVPPASYNFITNQYGKPALAHSHNKGVQFSLAHSHELGLLAVARATVGVDIEWMRENLEFDSIARRFFAPGERSRIENLPTLSRHRAFFHVWTRKEAYIKALGVGLLKPLDSFEVSIDPEERDFSISEDGRMLDWTLRSLPIDEGYAAALAVASPNQTVKLWDFERA